MSGLVFLFSGMVPMTVFYLATGNLHCDRIGVSKGIGCKGCENTTLTLNIRGWNFYLPIIEYLAFVPKNTFKAPYLLTVG